MRLAFVSLGSPATRAAWSGIPFYALREIRRRFPDTHVIDTARLDEAVRKWSALSRVGLFPAREPLVVAAYTAHLNRRLAEIAPDAVVSIGAAHKVAAIDREWPVVYMTDALFSTITRYYPKYAALNARTLRLGDRLQQQLITRSHAVVLASEWAASSARDASVVPDGRLHVVPMGANLDEDPGFSVPPDDGTLRLLFVGYDWHRKGGPIVLDAFRRLAAQGVQVELHIAGCRPKEAEGIAGVVVHGALQKWVPEESALLTRLFRGCSFFFMPSRWETFGLVYCEAAAFGRPVVATRTGGVSAPVEDGATGLLLPTEAGGADYAEAILEVWRNPERYRRMCAAARAAYETRLNWGAWGASLQGLLLEIDGARAVCAAR
ncbi:MAG: glycosyltransferase family 4 protein [Alphaproteobacteria bacterium]|nr:glycosyltransferase family 4 protein [Alphaproteobacteria bacterium]